MVLEAQEDAADPEDDEELIDLVFGIVEQLCQAVRKESNYEAEADRRIVLVRVVACHGDRLV